MDNGIAFYSDKNKKIFFDVVQPNKDMISSNLSAGTLSFELSGFGENIKYWRWNNEERRLIILVYIYFT